MTTTQRHELLAWLGDDWTSEQAEQVIEQYGAWERAHLDASDRLTEAVLAAIAQRVAGDLDLDALGTADRQAQAMARRTRLESQAAVMALDVAGLISRTPGAHTPAPGTEVTEAELAQRLGVDRMTVRRHWLRRG